MCKENAVAFLKFLHDIENKFNGSLFTAEYALHVEHIRLEFIKLWRGQHGHRTQL